MSRIVRWEICGGIASGKTTLAQLLAQNGFIAEYENFEANPFWESFYKDPIGAAFETEITFFLQHYHGIKVAQKELLPVVHDHSLLLDLAYARVTLRGRRLDIFESIFLEIWNELQTPRLLVYLKCGPSIELSRIRKRARKVEQAIDLQYMSVLNETLDAVVKEFGQDIRIHEIDSASINFVDDSATQFMIVSELLTKLDVQ